MIGRLALWLGVATLVAAQCPYPYVHLNQTRCILIDPYLLLPYSDAVDYCTTHGGTILTYSDCATSALLYDFIRSEEGTTNHHYWLGTTGQAEDGVWKFVDYQPTPLGTPFWGPGEPIGGEQSNFVILHFQNNHFWYDALCTSSYSVICLRNL